MKGIFKSRLVLSCATLVLLAGGLAGLWSGIISASASSSQVTHTTASTSTLHLLGTVNLTTIAQANAGKQKAAATVPNGHRQETPLRLLHPDASSAQHAAAAASLAAGSLSQFGGNVKGAQGFDGITAAINSAANSPSICIPDALHCGVGDVSPPDQGLAVGPGPSPNPTVIAEIVNDTLNFYAPNGKTLLGAVAGFQLFGLTPNAFLSDPRAYWDPQTGHWFFTMFTSAPGDEFQYIAVSQAANPFSTYAVFAIPTDDSTNTAGGCPCFGDFDQLGSDYNGIYIATNQFNLAGTSFNGSVIYAISKGGLIAAANGGPLPTLVTYTVPFLSNSFGAYHLSPSTVTQGSSSPSTEYFVESNGNLNFLQTGSGLNVYALLGTQVLNTGGTPPLVLTSVGTESYTFPINAPQKNGPTPLGSSLGLGVAQLQTDFNAVQEVTYANGLLLAELSTAFAYGTGQNTGAAWFVLKPKTWSSSISVTNSGNGYVETSQNLLYPVIGVNAAGKGYMAFAVSGINKYPSAAYVTFNGTKGAGGTVFIQASGVWPLDDFTCYPPFGPACRYGDYSMAQAYNGKIYMATEYTAPQPRDYFSNWATRVWSAPQK